MSTTSTTSPPFLFDPSRELPVRVDQATRIDLYENTVQVLRPALVRQMKKMANISIHIMKKLGG